jgi:biopolymer transport protein ExbD
MTELNITPLLDLAFVLLVIFIITTAPIVNDAEVKLPKASKHPKDPPKEANYITVDAEGKIAINAGQTFDVAELQPKLAVMRTEHPDLSVIVRADSKTKYGKIRAVLDGCQQANMIKVELATEAYSAEKK